jgi:hypothetical protein
MSRNGRRFAAMALSAIGTLLVIKTVIEFLS